MAGDPPPPGFGPFNLWPSWPSLASRLGMMESLRSNQWDADYVEEKDMAKTSFEQMMDGMTTDFLAGKEKLRETLAQLEEDDDVVECNIEDEWETKPDEDEWNRAPWYECNGCNTCHGGKPPHLHLIGDELKALCEECNTVYRRTMPLQYSHPEGRARIAPLVVDAKGIPREPEL